MVRLAFNLLLLAGFSAISFSQTTPVLNSKPEASVLLRQIGKKYSEAQYYLIEAVTETETKSDLSRNWNKLFLTATVVPGNRYRFEVRSEFGRPLKVSDGKTETNYNAGSKEYTQQAAPDSGPAIPKLVIYGTEQGELEHALEILKDLSKTDTTLVSPEYLQDEKLVVNGRKISCYVIKGRGRYLGGSPGQIVDVTFWIDKEKFVIRKRLFHAEGPIIVGNHQHYVEDQVTLYTAMDINSISVADTLFSFQPPTEARLVHELSDPRHPADKLAGTQSPAFELQDATGKKVTLQDFHGKPVLLDFWATWCAPCVAAIEPLKKLHAEAATRGLTILSIDEDEETEAGNKFFAEHKVPWTNFHDDGEIWRSFPGGQGIPFYVLIDANGQIAFSRSAAQDTELRAAIAKLGIDVQLKETKSDGKAKP